MAGVSGTGVKASAQYRAVARIRWQILRNSLRRSRGQFELVARVITTLVFALTWGAVSIGLGFLAWQSALLGHLSILPLLLWPVLVLWQVTPIMLASFQENVDLSLLLRFPVRFRSYVLLYLVFGLFDLSSLMGSMVLIAIWLGLVIASPSLFWIATPALALFGLFNLLLTRMIFSWIDRWLAQRRTREFLGILVLFAVICLQLLNPAGRKHSTLFGNLQQSAVFETATRIQGFFPPGLAAAAIAHHNVEALVSIGTLVLYTLAAGALLSVRLHAEYRGESLGAASPLSVTTTAPRLPPVLASTAQPAAHAHVLAAIIRKELRYLSRSGVMLFSLVAPLVLVFIAGGSSLAQDRQALKYALPVAVAYCFLPLTRQVCNSLGGEGAGIQLYFISPTPIRTVMLAKNIIQVGLFALEVGLASIIMVYRFGQFPFGLVTVTLCWLLFALPLQLAVGNLLSITMAYRMTLTRLSREEGATGNGLVSLLVQLVTFGIGVGLYLCLNLMGQVRIVPAVLLALAICSFIAWRTLLSRVDTLAMDRRESLIATLVRPA